MIGLVVFTSCDKSLQKYEKFALVGWVYVCLGLPTKNSNYCLNLKYSPQKISVVLLVGRKERFFLHLSPIFYKY